MPTVSDVKTSTPAWITREGELILLSYDSGTIRSNDVFLAALASANRPPSKTNTCASHHGSKSAPTRYAWLIQNLFVGHQVDSLARRRLATTSIACSDPPQIRADDQNCDGAPVLNLIPLKLSRGE